MSELMKIGLQRTPQPRFRLRFRRASWLLCLAVLGMVSALVVGVVLFCVVRRAVYPFELSWMEGCFVDHARRVAAGEALYAPASAEFISLPYTPIVHFVAAWLMRMGVGGFLATRLVSILSVLVAALVGMWLATRATRHKLMCLLVPVLIAARYFDVDGYYDVARPDNLVALFSVLALAALTLRSAFLAVPLFVLFATGAIFTKQSSFVLFAVLLVGLSFVRWRVALVSSIALSAVVAEAFVWVNSATGGWFRVFILDIPSRHYVSHRALAHSLVCDFLGDFVFDGCRGARAEAPGRSVRPTSTEFRGSPGRGHRSRYLLRSVSLGGRGGHERPHPLCSDGCCVFARRNCGSR